MQPALDQTTFKWNHLNVENLIYSIKLEQLIRVHLNAGCSSAIPATEPRQKGKAPLKSPWPD